MHNTNFDAEDQRFGSAAFASRGDIQSAGLFNGIGQPIGYFGDKALHLAGDAPKLTVSGAGGGKSRDLLGYVVCAGTDEPTLINDPRGELAAISLHTLAPRGIKGYCWNPMGVCGLPQHGCNPLDILRLDCPYLSANTAFLMEGFFALSGSANGRYFELKAREWVGALTKSRVEQNGYTSLPDLYRVINTIEGSPDAWVDQLTAMRESRFVEVRRSAEEIIAKQHDSPKEFSGILGEIYVHTAFLNDPHLRHALEDGFSLAELISLPSHPQKARVYINIPAEYLSIWAPVIRLFFVVTMLYKQHAPSARRVNLIVDEAGQLGKFEALLSNFTFGRGAGIRAWALFQDLAQMQRNYGDKGMQSFFGSAQMRQLFGIRDFETAKLASDMLGTQTLEYDDEPAQRNANRQKFNAVRDVLFGADPFERSYDYAHYGRESSHRTKKARPLLTPDEILALPDFKQLLFISGKNLRPILADKYPYFTRREMAGKYLPNPYHPPLNQVRIKTRFGSKLAYVCSGPVPAKYKLFPQYADGRALWVDGYPLS